METFIVTFNPEQKEGVFGVSLVENPAIEVDFVALSKEEENLIQLQTIDEDKQILVGAVLIPNKVIPRITPEGVPYNIVFPKETIALAQEYFFKRNNQHNSTIEHDLFQFIDGFTIIESWIKEDTAMDKSNLYGFNAPVGTWFAMAKVDNPEVWQKVKSGEVKGFSIDAYFDMEPLNQNYMLSEIVNAIKEGFAQLSAQPEQVEEVQEVVTEPIAQEEEVVVETAPVAEVEQPKEEVQLSSIVKELAIELGKEIEKAKVELRAEMQKLIATEPSQVVENPTQLTKAKPEVQVDEPKDFRAKILSKLKNS